MKQHLTPFALLTLLMATVTSAAEAAPVQQDQEFRDRINRYTTSNFYGAIMNVAAQSEMKRLTIFATANVKPETVQIEAFTITLLANPDIAANHLKWQGMYHEHHNSITFGYAASLADTQPEVFQTVIALMSKATPDFAWTHPIHANMTLAAIAAIEDPEHMLFVDEKHQWHWRYNTYLTSTGRPVADYTGKKVTIPGELLVPNE